MTLRPVLAAIQDEDSFAPLAAAASGAAHPLLEIFASAAVEPYLIAAALDAPLGGAERPALVVAGDDRSARDLAVNLRAYLAPRPVRQYPARGVRYESHLAPAAHLVGLRIAALDSLLEWNGGGEAPVVVASAAALAEKVPHPELRPHGFALRPGQELDLTEAARRLAACGYERVDQVEDRAQFAIRGGILDIFPATEDRAVRCELFGDEIERLNWFSTFTQRSLGDAPLVDVDPASELAVEHRELAELAADEPASERPDIAELLPVDRFADVISLIPAETVTVLAAVDELKPALADLWQDISVTMAAADAEHLYLDPEAAHTALLERATLAFSAQSRDQPHAFRVEAADFAARDLRGAELELKKLTNSGYRAVVAWQHRGEAERAQHNLAGLGAGLVGMDGGEPWTLPSTAGVSFAQAVLTDGFVWPDLRLAVVPDRRLVRRRRAPAARPAARARLKSFTDLRVGEYVVHADHGVARLAGFETRTVAGVTRDYLYLEYAGEDRVYVPYDQLAKISSYIGADGTPPPLSKLGGARWETLKARARTAVQEIAGELIGLYARRRRQRGHAFVPDGEWQIDFERAFPFRETSDQLEVIEQVKSDMEAPRPMDRLVCGDVGYGKTEVALRAAFKAATEGKQVMFLVPTTILAQQHLGTFRERLRDFPVRVEPVSRLRSASENRQVLADFAAGKVEILIGTHRLLSRDVVPDDLGLLILDEEQRFGVRQKELLRQLKLRVDVISMSATPIPRTLQMSLAGLRDISVMEEPPEGRRPVHTYVGEYDERLVKQAIEREVKRGGQVFFLHNRVETIERTADELRNLCPRVRFAVAHGQLHETDLEKAMLAFLRGDSDCLVCTTIIEAGLDIPQANTLIVDRADHLGLAQLYQIRGRVGRSRSSAYAYLLYPSAEHLTREAAARLATLSDYTELGSGFKIAMRDLELRGAGNLLGDEQSGHVAAVGFELYCEMLDQAVEALAAAEQGEGIDGQLVSEERELVRLDVEVDAYVPADYVPHEVAKIDLHRRIATATELADLAAIRQELEDRFGPAPGPVVNLLRMAEARIKFARLGARNVTLRRGRLSAAPVRLRSDQFGELRERLEGLSYDRAGQQISVRFGNGKGKSLEDLLETADAILAARS